MLESIKDLKAMLESSKAVITNLKHQESLLKSQISDQDRKIEQLKASLNGSTTEVRSQSSATIVIYALQLLFLTAVSRHCKLI